MTREDLRAASERHRVGLGWYAVPDDSQSADAFREVRQALEEAWAKLDAWEACGLTEEMLRSHDGYLKIDRGVVLVSEHYLSELQAEIDALKQQNLDLIMERDHFIRQLEDVNRRLGEVVERHTTQEDRERINGMAASRQKEEGS